jgi:hypothetical protein
MSYEDEDGFDEGMQFAAQNPKELKKSKRKDQLITEREAEHVRHVMNTFQGRAFVWKVLSECRVFHQAPPDHSAVLRHEGKRDIGLIIMNKLLQDCPEQYNMMQVEGVSRDAKDKGNE